MTSGIFIGRPPLNVPRLWWTQLECSLATLFGPQRMDRIYDALYQLEGTAELTCTDLLDLDCKFEQLWAEHEGLA